MKLYIFEVQLPFAPACGWLHSDYVRPTFGEAMTAAVNYAENAERNGITIGIRVRALDADETCERDVKIWAKPK